MNENKENPWLGLESYKEGQKIYGRNDDISSLSYNVLTHIATLFYGKSGIGKSSILNAGVLREARNKLFLPVVIRLSHRENRSYILQIDEAIRNAMCPICSSDYINVGISEKEMALRDEELSNRIKEVEKCKFNDRELIYEYFHRHTFYDKRGYRLKLLLIFDQFEEIFTLQTDKRKVKQFFDELSDQINDFLPQELKTVKDNVPLENKSEIEINEDSDLDSLILDEDPDYITVDRPNYVYDNDIHFVFTIREDFLSELEYYASSMPFLLQNKYGLRPINEKQAYEIITKPCRGLVDDNVAKLIISKITQLDVSELNGNNEIEVDAAVLSLFMNRLFDSKEGDKITADLVNSKGGEIISNFYSDALKDISDKAVEYLEDNLLTGHGRRNNISIYSAIESGNVTEKEINILCNEKHILRQFYYANDLRIEFVHDILCNVVKQHKEERIRLKLQTEEEKKRLELQKAEEEKRRKLKEAEEEKRRKLKEEEEQKRIELQNKADEDAARMKRRNRKRFLISLVTIVVIVALAAVYYRHNYNKNDKVYKEYFLKYTHVNGYPVGIGIPLTDVERHSKSLYYKLSHVGTKNGEHHTEVEVMSSNENLPNSCRLLNMGWTDKADADLKAGMYNDILKKVTKVRYSSTDGKVSKQEFLDHAGNALMTISYFYVSSQDAWAYFYTPKGENMKIRDNGIDRIKFSWDSIGNIKSLMCYDFHGVPQSIDVKSETKGFLWNRESKDRTIRYSLNEYGLPIRNYMYNTIVNENRGDTLITTYMRCNTLNDNNVDEVLNSQGYSKSVEFKNRILLYKPNEKEHFATRKIAYDKKGNVTEIKTSGDNITLFPAVIKYSYDKGFLIKEERLTAAGKPFCLYPDDTYEWNYKYDDKNCLTGEVRKNIKGISYNYSMDTHPDGNDTVRVLRLYDKHQRPQYVVKVDTLRKGKTITSFYGKDNNPINKSVLVGESYMALHRMETTREDNKIVTECYVVDTTDIKPMPTVINDFGKAVSYFKRIEETDNLGNTTSLTIEDSNGKTVKSMMYFIQNGHRIGRAVKGIDGTPVRCDKWEDEGFLYYKYYFNTDNEGQISCFTAVDEWDNKSVVKSGVSYRSAKWFNFKDVEVIVNPSHDSFRTKIFKEYGQLIFTEDMDLADAMLPYIHVLSKKSKFYNNKKGLLDGDRIFRLGNWKIGENIEKLNYEWNKAIERKSLDIIVLRPTSKSFEKIQFSLACDSDEYDLIEYHVLDMSESEANFMLEYLNKK